MNSIDERALEALSFISTLSNQLSGFNSKTNNLSKYFPTFIWLIRDFALDLTNKNNSEVIYLKYIYVINSRFHQKNIWKMH